MFSKLFFIVSIFAAVTAIIPASQCNTMPVQCCNSAGFASDGGFAALLALLGIVDDPNDLVGVTCSPITNLGSASCAARPLCCTNNSFNGIVALGCVPVNLNA